MSKKSATPSGVLDGGKEPASAPEKGKKKPTKKSAKKPAKKTGSRSSAPKPGRPTLYDPASHPRRAFELCLLGATDAQMASAFAITEATLQLWKLKHKAFSDSIKEGKMAADAKVAASLYQRALGYSHPDEEIKVVDKSIERVSVTKHYPPDATSMIFWLKNRQGFNWRERSITEVVGKNDGPIEMQVGTPTDYAMLRAKAKAARGAA